MTKSLHFVSQLNSAVQQICLGNCQFSIQQTVAKQTNMASCDTDDDIIISSALLITSTLYQRHQVNVRKRKRNSWPCEWIIT